MEDFDGITPKFDNKEFKSYDVGVSAEFETAVAKAKEFHPITKIYIDGYTGEVSRYKTPDNYVPDEGVVNDQPDLCHTDDFVSIAQIYERLKQIRALSLQDSEFDFNEDDVSADDLDETTLSDVITEVDDPSDYENIVEPFYNEKYGEHDEQQESDSAAVKTAPESKNDDKAPEVAAEE